MKTHFFAFVLVFCSLLTSCDIYPIPDTFTQYRTILWEDYGIADSLQAMSYKVYQTRWEASDRFSNYIYMYDYYTEAAEQNIKAQGVRNITLDKTVFSVLGYHDKTYIAYLYKLDESVLLPFNNTFYTIVNGLYKEEIPNQYLTPEIVFTYLDLLNQTYNLFELEDYSGTSPTWFHYQRKLDFTFSPNIKTSLEKYDFEETPEPVCAPLIYQTGGSEKSYSNSAQFLIYQTTNQFVCYYRRNNTESYKFLEFFGDYPSF